jgi:hypothetical protein
VRTIHHTNRWTVGQWQFFEIDGREISDTYEGRKLFGYADNTVDASAEKSREWFNSLEHAMAAAIAEKYTGPRGAGGTGVGTAADWFMRMIGADQLVAVDHRETQSALTDVIAATARYDGPIYRRAQAMETELEARGLTLARQNHA